MIIVLNDVFFLSICFFFMTISGCIMFKENEITVWIEMISYGMLFLYFIIHSKKYKIKYSFFSVFILFLLCIGLMVQDLPFMTILKICFMMVIIWMSIFCTEGSLDDLSKVRKISYSIINANILSAFITFLLGGPLIDHLSENISSWGLSFGIVYKNYFAANLLMAFIGVYLYRKYQEKNMMDLFVEVISVIMLVFTFSKGAWLLLIMFLVIINLDCIYKIKKEQRGILLLIVFLIGVAMASFIFMEYIVTVETYLYRLRGLDNYLSYYADDISHLMFGNGEYVYSSDYGYVEAIRSKTGWDGTLELAWLNILIKNGAIGIVGFLLIFLMYIRKIWLFNSRKSKMIYSSIFAILLASSLVEPYIQSFHGTAFGLYCYMIMSGSYGKS